MKTNIILPLEKVKMHNRFPAVRETEHAGHPAQDTTDHKAERPDITSQLQSASRLGHSLGATRVGGAAPFLVQRLENPEEEKDKEKLQMQREPDAVQRQAVPDEDRDKEKLQMQRESDALQRQQDPEEEKKELQTKLDDPQVGPEGGRVPPTVESAINRARGEGQLLDDGVQAQMSQTLGHDFSGVRVHTGEEADALNRQLSAKAFTTGQDIFFQRGAYDPASGSGHELIAHELTHVAQQSAGRVSGDGGGMTARPAGDALEQEADVLGKKVLQSKTKD